MEKSDKILKRLLGLHPKKIDLSLNRVQRLLGRLGNPHKSLSPVIHVAGTNGKGSSIAFMRSILEAAGYRVNVYSSPHLVRFNERIRLSGSLISDDSLADLLEHCETANADDEITYFEITTVAAFEAFNRYPADIVLLECGLGGRFDATTVIDSPVVTAITPISMDHMQFLGGTLTKIAGEKSAIQKSGVPSVIGAQEEAAGRVIQTDAVERNAILYRFGKEWFVRRQNASLIFDSNNGKRRLPAPALHGSHQFDNAGLAIACLENLKSFKINDACIAKGLQTVYWPGRAQYLRKGELAQILPMGWELWLDGGHNAAAGSVLSALAQGWNDKSLYLVFGMSANKRPSEFLRPLAKHVKELYAVYISGDVDSLPAQVIVEKAKLLGIHSKISISISNALWEITNHNLIPGRVLICGSLYLVGQVLSENGTIEL